MTKQISNRRVVTYSALFILAVGVLTAVLYPYLQGFTEPENQASIQRWINEAGAAGVLVVLLAQMLQVVIAFIPGEPFELIAGVLYGAVGGLALCLAGCVAASAVVFLLSKRFGRKLLHRLFGKEKVDNWKWLHDNKNVEMITFLLFFIPGTPKDMLTYLVGTTEMGVVKFLCISTLARIPSVFSSTVIGSSIIQGEWGVSVLVFIITGVVGIVGIGFRDKLIAFCRRLAKHGEK